MMTPSPLWQPTAKQIAEANITALQNQINDTFSVQLETYADLHQWSVDNTSDFWNTIVETHPVIFHDKAKSVVTEGTHLTDTKWFEGATLNYAENLLIPIKNLDEALIAYAESTERKNISGKELFDNVARLAAYLKTKNISKGDRVAGIVGNSIETITAMLAVTSLGAVWSSASPDFGEKGILDRFSQIEPKFLFCSCNYQYAGKQHDISNKVNTILDKIDSIEHCIDITNNSTFESLDSVLALHQSDIEIHFEPVPFNHPLYIMYSSGTTGKPKCIIHSVGGALTQHVKEHRYHVNLKPKEKLFFFTTCGWMMWNWLVSGLANGNTLILFDGSPFNPSESILFDIMEKEQCNVMGISPKYLLSCEKAGVLPINTHNLTSLHTILSTGSPLSEQNFRYVYSSIKKDVCLSSVSGGTDILACFLGGNSTLPVYAGELQCKGLAMDVQIVNDTGKPVVNEKGELICVNAFPSMPIGFWDDPKQERYLAAYFSTFDNKWCQSDMAEEIAHPSGASGYMIHGRSDTVLNPGGVRIGTAEIYRQIEPLAEIVESVVIGQMVNSDVEVVLFVVLTKGVELTEELIKTIKTAIRKGASPRHVPARVIQVQDTPKTLSGKIAEKAVMNIMNGYATTNRETLANPESLDEYELLKGN